jgi:hypothetical protein
MGIPNKRWHNPEKRHHSGSDGGSARSILVGALVSSQALLLSKKGAALSSGAVMPE